MADDDILALNDAVKQRTGILPDRDPNLTYLDYLPIAFDPKTGESFFAYPETVRELVSAFETPAKVARGEITDLEKAARDVAFNVAPAGGIAGLATVPKGTVLAMGAGRVNKPVISTFTTSRGSTYELFDDLTTQRNRSGRNHTDTSEGLQPDSLKTVFVDKEGLINVGAMFQNPDVATRLDPVFNDKGKIKSMALRLTEDYGPRRAGDTLAEVPVTTRPEVGKYPVEIISPESPRGSSGSGVHFGSEIIDVQSQTPIAKADKPTRRPDGSYRYKEFDIVKDGKEYRFSHPSDEGYELSADTLDDAQTQIDDIFKETFGEVLSDEKATGWLKNHGYDPYVGIGPRPKTPYYEFTEDGAIKTYTPYRGNKSGVEVKTFRNPTRKQLRDWMGYKSGGRVERNPYNYKPRTI